MPKINLDQTTYMLDGSTAWRRADPNQPVRDEKGVVTGYKLVDSTYRHEICECLSPITKEQRDLTDDDFWKSGMLLAKIRTTKIGEEIDIESPEAMTVRKAVRLHCPNMELALQIRALVEGKDVSKPECHGVNRIAELVDANHK